MKQKVCVPNYWEQFNCIASKCEETCCAGWYIAIDEAAYKKYKKVKDPQMKKRLDKELVARKGSVSRDCVAKIKLKNNRCAFLAKDNLCDIYRNLGENYLSETCKVYPRNVNEVYGKLELSLTLSCPEAARIILKTPSITFSEEEDHFHLPVVGGKLEGQNGKLKHFEQGILGIRKQLITILQEREVSFARRWQCLEEAMKTLDRMKKKQDVKALADWLQQDLVKTHLKAQKNDEETKISFEKAEFKKAFSALVKMRTDKKWSSQSYESCYQMMVKGLSEGTEEVKCSDEKFEQGLKLFNDQLEGPWRILFENYFVHYIYERLVPMDQKTPLESFEVMARYLKMLTLHLCGMLVERPKLEESLVIQLIQGMTRVFDHDEQTMEQFKKLCLNSNN